MTRCSVCERPCVREVEPAFGVLPAVTVPDVWTVAYRNRLHFDACERCWGVWPDPWKVFPAEGFGRSRERIDGLVAVLRETAA